MNIMTVVVAAALVAGVLTMCAVLIITKYRLDSQRLAAQRISMLERVLAAERDPVALARKFTAETGPLALAATVHDKDLRRRLDALFSTVAERLREPPPETRGDIPDDQKPPPIGEGVRIPAMGIVSEPAP
ncbi:MAG TPA: hypothetical protein VE871_01200 [Longimicrobium sp.]|nr:hypothetical protein [Longimicrobium sp.]